MLIARQLAHFAAKYVLLQHGLLLAALELDDRIDRRSLAPGAKLGGEADKKRGKNKEQVIDDEAEESGAEEEGPKTAEEFIDAIESYVSTCLATMSHGGPEKSQASAALLRTLERDFYKAVPQTCQNCKAANPGFRKEGYLKVFEKRESEKMRRRNEAKGLKKAGAIDLVRAREGVKEKKDERRGMEVDEVDREGSAEEDNAIPVDSDEEEEDGDVNPVRMADDGTPAKQPTGDRYLTPLELRAHIEQLFKNEKQIMDLLFGQYDPKTGKKVADPSFFFLDLIPVAPIKFRPASKMNDSTYDHPQSTILTKILKANALIVQLRVDKAPGDRILRTWMDLQGEVNALFDTTKAGDKARNSPPGIRQLLEKKEGLFRKHMMGKRVNYAARSVISPDVMVEGNEIGIPPYFATRLTYPSPVTPHNVHILRQAVINGPSKWPGATHVMQEDGSLLSLGQLDEVARTALANSLLTPHVGVMGGVPKVVHRHLVNGDFLLLNRQPTLHKPSIMAHTARILKGEKTLRMHYANCNTYNADFDGDEMNVHFPQNELARAEAMLIARNDLQYLVPTSGGVLRGLIQDHIDAAVHMCDKRTTFRREEVMQLVYAALRPEGGVSQGVGDGNVEAEVEIGRRGRILMLPPAIIKPVVRWTGKQIISIVMLNLTAAHKPLNLTSKARIGGRYWSHSPEEEKVEIMDGELLTGVLDKNQIGASTDGVVHAFYEVYGPRYAGKLLSVFGRLFTTYLQHRGFTCGIDDLTLTEEGDQARKKILSKARKGGMEAAIEFARLARGRVQHAVPPQPAEVRRLLEDALRVDEQMKALDSSFKSAMNKLTTEAIGAVMPGHLEKAFPANGMQLMTVAGAKGSAVNTSQISVCLGQQELEGRRVPTMVSGKTLPSFRPFETNPIAGGYVAGRFLTGIRPQEYYFHCMAGREGLIDTAVKTSRSGYLQRCLIKHLEGLKVHYDNTVRDADGSVVQFYYGEDSLDVMKQKSLTNFKLWAMNYNEIVDKVKPAQVAQSGRIASSPEVESHMKEAIRTNFETPTTTMSVYQPTRYLGATSERFAKELEEYIKKDADGLLGKSEDKSKRKSKSTLNGRKFRSLMQLKYLLSLVDPGEAVGVLAGQGVGEPSTQMTLNTFHFAGFGAANVTLGIPRLRELLMTASTKIKTPLMTLPLLPHVTEAQKTEICSHLSRLVLSQITKSVEVRERIVKSEGGGRTKVNVVRIQFWTEEEYLDEFGVTKGHLEAVLEKRFVTQLYKAIDKELKKLGVKITKGDKEVEDDEIGKPQKRIGDGSGPSRKSGGDDESAAGGDDEGSGGRGGGKAARELPDSDDEEDDGGDDREEDEQDGDVPGVAGRGTGNKATYDAPDEDEEQLIREARREAGDFDEDFESEIQSQSQRYGDGESMAEFDDEEGEQERDQKGRTAEERVLSTTKHISRYMFDRKQGSWCEVHLTFASDAPKLLMLGLVESVLTNVVIQEVKGIARVYPVEDVGKDGVHKLAVEGVNLLGVWNYPDLIDVDSIYTNDIGAVLRTYGVEAARAAIISEMAQVFGVYGIGVDRRHLSLIADYMVSFRSVAERGYGLPCLKGIY